MFPGAIMTTSDSNNVAYSQIMERIYSVTNTKTQAGLAGFLGIRRSSIYEAKKREAIPAEWLLTLWRKKGVSPDWIVYKVGSKFLKPTDEEAGLRVVYVTERRPPEECSAQELVNELVRRALENK